MGTQCKSPQWRKNRECLADKQIILAGAVGSVRWYNCVQSNMILKKNLKTYFSILVFRRKKNTNLAYTLYGSNDIYHSNIPSIRRLGYKVKIFCVCVCTATSVLGTVPSISKEKYKRQKKKAAKQRTAIIYTHVYWWEDHICIIHIGVCC